MCPTDERDEWHVSGAKYDINGKKIIAD